MSADLQLNDLLNKPHKLANFYCWIIAGGQ
uniref:Uncharacterized protein n=1 Tax=Anguilla anguilla TaxID=7936 RepID=A0A0E9S2U3_ANGAN